MILQASVRQAAVAVDDELVTLVLTQRVMLTD